MFRRQGTISFKLSGGRGAGRGKPTESPIDKSTLNLKTLLTRPYRLTPRSHPQHVLCSRETSGMARGHDICTGQAVCVRRTQSRSHQARSLCVNAPGPRALECRTHLSEQRPLHGAAPSTTQRRRCALHPHTSPRSLFTRRLAALLTRRCSSGIRERSGPSRSGEGILTSLSRDHKNA